MRHNGVKGWRISETFEANEARENLKNVYFYNRFSLVIVLMENFFLQYHKNVRSLRNIYYPFLADCKMTGASVD